MSTVNEYGGQLAIKSDLIENLSKIIKNRPQEKLASEIEVEEYEKEIYELKGRKSSSSIIEDDRVG